MKGLPNCSLDNVEGLVLANAPVATDEVTACLPTSLAHGSVGD